MTHACSYLMFLFWSVGLHGLSDDWIFEEHAFTCHIPPTQINIGHDKFVSSTLGLSPAEQGENQNHAKSNPQGNPQCVG
jgi:hypothetical protein